MPDTYNDFRTDHLNEEQKAIASIVMKVVGKYFHKGDCCKFCVPQELKRQGKFWGADSRLVLFYDKGGVLDSFIRHEYSDYRLTNALDDAGYYIAHRNSFYSAVYKWGD
jgi:hypothetical protein